MFSGKIAFLYHVAFSTADRQLIPVISILLFKGFDVKLTEGLIFHFISTYSY